MSRARRLHRGAAEKNDEKGQEDEKECEDLTQKLLREDAEEGKRKMEEQLRKDDSMALKLNPLGHPQRLSDSENEEPYLGRTLHRSAFVSKNNCNSLTSLTWTTHSKAERSQSCNDTVADGLPQSRRRATQIPKAKVSSGGCTSTGIVGVLLSTENSRSFSAPVLTSEKRLTVSSLTSFTPLHKPERSISPESNDSISEELNHFKPIVCSPCTPPKRLPDGRVLSPIIIKSTPRNLRQSLQKPTTYEASPMILKKWEQVFKERQMKRTVSKGTLTSSVEVEDSPTQSNHVSSSKELVGLKTRLRSADTVLRNLEYVPSSSKEAILESNSDKSQAFPGNDFLLGSGKLSEDSGATEPMLNVNPNSCLGDSHIGTKVRVTARLSSKVKSVSQCNSLGATIKPALKRPHKNNCQPINMQNGTCFAAAKNISPEFPQRRGQKRRCKTKHLEQNGSLKRLKAACGDSCTHGFERFWRETEKRLKQEEEDKKLALKLQRSFDKESRTVNRCKGSRDEYPLRSKSTAGAN
ncbi:E3 ubiquitin-protein ligase RNF169 [Ascaphus truei]|uniref:E3 ubiquitin-protein ligase RNF169 n=1 Tax=Ascaphus truei TaxID=8439 RepID=UPI003F59520E